VVEELDFLDNMQVQVVELEVIENLLVHHLVVIL